MAWAPNGKELAVERRGVGAAGQSVWLVSVNGQVRALTSLGLSTSTNAPSERAALGARGFSPAIVSGPFPVLGSWNPQSTALTLWLSPVAPRGSSEYLPFSLWTEARGAQETSVSMYPYREFMSWSPDGRAVALVEPEDVPGSSVAISRLVVASATGGAPVVVSADDQTVGDLAWSPDGRYIAYAASSVGTPTAGSAGRRIWLVSPDGAERRALTLGPDDEFPQWSRDGTSLIYVHQSATDAEVWSDTPDGKQAPQRIITGLVALRDLSKQFFGASGLVSYRGIFAWNDAAPAQ